MPSPLLYPLSSRGRQSALAFPHALARTAPFLRGEPGPARELLRPFVPSTKCRDGPGCGPRRGTGFARSPFEWRQGSQRECASSAPPQRKGPHFGGAAGESTTREAGESWTGAVRRSPVEASTQVDHSRPGAACVRFARDVRDRPNRSGRSPPQGIEGLVEDGKRGQLPVSREAKVE